MKVTYPLAAIWMITTLLPHIPLNAAEPTQRDIEFARIGDRSLTLDFYQPLGQAAHPAPTIIWVHGGAWRAGSKNDVPVLRWREHGFAIASIEYRLSPEAPFPAQIHDIKGAIRYLRAHASDLHLDPERFVVAGASAGGHLAALTGVSDGVDQLRGEVGNHLTQSSAVQAIVSFYGASNLQTILAQSTPHGLSVRVPALQLLLGGQPDEKPELAKLASPVAHVDAKDPPLWLIHGDADPQMPPRQSDELKTTYEQAGLRVALDVVSGGRHGGDEFYSTRRLDQIAEGLLKALPPRSSSPVRMLFAGSSSTYWNDMPNEIAKILAGRSGLIAGRGVVADLVGRSGSDIRVYLDPNCDYQYGVRKGQSFLDKVRDEKFDCVVLMTVCRFIMGDGDQNPDGQAHRDAIGQYCDAIRQAGSEPVFYEMGWGTTQREVEGRRRILELARQNNIQVYVPCSTAWARVRSERPDLRLQHPDDNSHPGDLGHFLNLACFHAAFVKQSPAGELPRTFHVWPHLNKAKKEALRDELDAAFAEFKPDAYQAKLPEWMRRNAGAGYTATVSEDDARYLEQIAWESYQSIVEQLGKGHNQVK
ncbi:MAG: alpha/beta hydrolase [Pirellulaceae bacterium]